MIIPRIGAIFLLVGYGFAIAQVGRLMYVTASEGYSSWVGVAIFLAPVAIVGIASALLVLWRRPLGYRLVVPFLVLLGVTAFFTFFALPPIGGFLDDYEQASLARGVEVPDYLADDTTPEEYIEDETGDIRAQGALGSLAVGLIYGATTLRRGPRAKANQAKAGAEA